MADAEQQQDRPMGEQSEQEPLLGGPGDASQQSKPLYHNFVIGELEDLCSTGYHGTDLQDRHGCCGTGWCLDSMHESSMTLPGT